MIIENNQNWLMEWEAVAKAYQELLVYMDERIREAYAPQFDQLPVDMMTGGDQCGAKVVQADLHIGEAIEHEM
ncbi:putative DNA-directed RNA polymerase [Helianthus annuus]|nr:putative DNA-directed RNA polymerase [Helianthus annuus]KAJ0661756.1 putative DNA-directed RNA polymerase [Helianthus annuus]